MDEMAKSEGEMCLTQKQLTDRAGTARMRVATATLDRQNRQRWGLVIWYSTISSCLTIQGKHTVHVMHSSNPAGRATTAVVQVVVQI
jgi:hypothetical protein